MDVESNISNSKVIIFGGSGFIGSGLVKALLNANCEVTSVSKSTAKKDISNNLFKSIKHNFDTGPCDQIKDRSYDFIINCSGYIDHSDFTLNGRNIINNHFLGLMHIVETIKDIKFKKFLHIGSSDEYGQNIEPQVEYQRENPFTPYSFAKTASTHFLQMLHRNIEFPSIVVRPFLVYGPEQKNNRFIPYVIENCLKNNDFQVSAGNQMKDFLYIDDFIEAVFCSLESDNSLNGSIFNIGSGNPVSIMSVVGVIQRICNGGIPVFGSKLIPKKENQNLYADINLAKSSLNWAPKINLEEGLLKVIHHIKNL